MQDLIHPSTYYLQDTWEALYTCILSNSSVKPTKKHQNAHVSQNLNTKPERSPQSSGSSVLSSLEKQWHRRKETQTRVCSNSFWLALEHETSGFKGGKLSLHCRWLKYASGSEIEKYNILPQKAKSLQIWPYCPSPSLLASLETLQKRKIFR